MSLLQGPRGPAYLTYSSNVHPAESLADLTRVLREHIAPVLHGALGPDVAPVNLRIGMRQADELLQHPPLPSNSALSDAILEAGPGENAQAFLALLDELKLAVVSVNAFPIRDFHAPRVKEQVYSPPWTDGGRVLYTLKIAKALTLCMDADDRLRSSVSVPTGTFKGLYPDSEEVRSQCAHFLTECIRELARLERLTGKTVALGLEPEPMTTGETVDEFVAYFETILIEARQKFPAQLGITRAQAEELTRKFLTVNLDLCHQAVEFEDPVASLQKLRAAGIALSGLHLSAALKLDEPAQNAAGWERLKSLDEPRYLHQIVARQRDGALARFADLPDLWNPRRLKGKALNDFSELRCHFHVPLTAEFADIKGLASTRDVVGPAARLALREGLTDNFVVETYTWGVLAERAGAGNAAAQAAVGGSGLNEGLIREIQWARAQFSEQ